MPSSVTLAGPPGHLSAPILKTFCPLSSRAFLNHDRAQHGHSYYLWYSYSYPYTSLLWHNHLLIYIIRLLLMYISFLSLASS